MSARWGGCDCCGREDVRLTQVWYLGMETWACAPCRGADMEDENMPEGQETKTDG